MAKKIHKKTSVDEEQFAKWISQTIMKRRQGNIRQRHVMIIGEIDLLRQSSGKVEARVRAHFERARIGEYDVDTAEYQGLIFEHDEAREGEYDPSVYVRNYLEFIGTRVSRINYNLETSIDGNQLDVTNRYSLRV